MTIDIAGLSIHVIGTGACVKNPHVIKKLGVAVRKELDRK